MRGTRVAERVLVLSSRFPWPSITGDRGRAVAWLEALAPVADVTLVAPRGEVPDHAPRFRFVAAHRAPARLLAAAGRALATRLPATALLAAGYDWAGAVAVAEHGGGAFDAVVVLLARLHPWVYPHVRAQRRVLDAIDSLAANLEARARAAHGVASWLWRAESRRTARLEVAAAARYDCVVVVAEAERAAFGEGVRAIFHGVEIGDAAGGWRDFDVGFWGRLAYFANRDAAAVLLNDVWPRIRNARPEAKLLLAGADAPRWIRRRHGRDGVTVISPMVSRPALLRRVRVAVLPLRFGSGQSNKVLEAGEASCALVATPEALRGLENIARHAVVERDPQALADGVLGLLRDRSAAELQGRRLREIVEREFSREDACRRLAETALGSLNNVVKNNR
jgi:glycosyltransferase involved in cell wall biosynthesis